jgi:hypothetical protein
LKSRARLWSSAFSRCAARLGVEELWRGASPSRVTRHVAVSRAHLGGNSHVNVNPGSVWNFSLPDAFLIVKMMRSAFMTYDVHYDVHFGELRRSFVQPESDLSFSQDRSAPTSSMHRGQKAVTEMIIGPWYLDEFGNPTREIRARD